MVSFNFLATAAFAAYAMAATTPAEVVANIQSITEKSQALQEPASELTPLNGALVVLGQGPLPEVIFGFADIVATAGQAFAEMQGMAPVRPGDASDAIFDSFREFVVVHQELLNILIGEAGLFSTVPFIGAPMAAVLRQIETVVDTLANTLIDTLQGREDDVQEQGDMLSSTVDDAIKEFEGLSILSNDSDNADNSTSSDPITEIIESIIDLLTPGDSALPAIPSLTLPSFLPTGLPTDLPLPTTLPTDLPTSDDGSEDLPTIPTGFPTPTGFPASFPTGFPFNNDDDEEDSSDSLLDSVTDLLDSGASALPVKRALAFNA